MNRLLFSLIALLGLTTGSALARRSALSSTNGYEFDPSGLKNKW